MKLHRSMIVEISQKIIKKTISTYSLILIQTYLHLILGSIALTYFTVSTLIIKLFASICFARVSSTIYLDCSFLIATFVILFSNCTLPLRLCPLIQLLLDIFQMNRVEYASYLGRRTKAMKIKK